LSPALRLRLDEWSKKQGDQPSRSEAIRRLVEQALEHASRRHGTPPAAARKAVEIASHVIDKVSDKTLPPQVHAHRKRALIHGPKEFRDLRGNQPKTKR
jgi:metal-responsive CopG/Arc/MetJ family transcriptional regulator